MQFVEVTEIPKKSKSKHKKGWMKAWMDKFMNRGIKMAKVVYDENDYNGPLSCYNAYRAAVIRHVYPVDVKLRDGEVYLIRRDI